MNTWLVVLWKLLAITHRQVPSYAEAGDGCWEEGRAGGSRGLEPTGGGPRPSGKCVCVHIGPYICTCKASCAGCFCKLRE